MHWHPTETEFVTSIAILSPPSRQRFTPAEILMNFYWHESTTTLPKSMLYVWNRLTPLLSHGTILFPLSPYFFPGPQKRSVGLMPAVHHRRKDSPSQDLIEKKKKKETAFSVYFPWPYCYSWALRNRSDHISYRYPFNVGHRNDLGQSTPTEPKHESQDLSSNWFLFEQCITAWISSH